MPKGLFWRKFSLFISVLVCIYPSPQDGTQGQFFIVNWITMTTKIQQTLKRDIKNHWIAVSTLLDPISSVYCDVGRVFANSSGDWGSIPGWVIPKTLKMILDASLLNTQHYKVGIKGKVEQSRKRSCTLPYNYWKGSLRVALDYGRQLYTYMKTITSKSIKEVQIIQSDLRHKHWEEKVWSNTRSIGTNSSIDGWTKEK